MSAKTEPVARNEASFLFRLFDEAPDADGAPIRRIIASGPEGKLAELDAMDAATIALTALVGAIEAGGVQCRCGDPKCATGLMLLIGAAGAVKQALEKSGAAVEQPTFKRGPAH